MLKPPWKAALPPPLVPHKGCDQGRDTFEAGVDSFPQHQSWSLPHWMKCTKASALLSITKAPRKYFQMTFCVLGPVMMALGVSAKVNISYAYGENRGGKGRLQFSFSAPDRWERHKGP